MNVKSLKFTNCEGAFPTPAVEKLGFVEVTSGQFVFTSPSDNANTLNQFISLVELKPAAEGNTESSVTIHGMAIPRPYGTPLVHWTGKGGTAEQKLTVTLDIANINAEESGDTLVFFDWVERLLTLKGSFLNTLTGSVHGAALFVRLIESAIVFSPVSFTKCHTIVDDSQGGVVCVEMGQAKGKPAAGDFFRTEEVKFWAGTGNDKTVGKDLYVLTSSEEQSNPADLVFYSVNPDTSALPAVLVAEGEPRTISLPPTGRLVLPPNAAYVNSAPEGTDKKYSSAKSACKTIANALGNASAVQTIDIVGSQFDLNEKQKLHSSNLTLTKEPGADPEV